PVARNPAGWTSCEQQPTGASDRHVSKPSFFLQRLWRLREERRKDSLTKSYERDDAELLSLGGVHCQNANPRALSCPSRRQGQFLNVFQRSWVPLEPMPQLRTDAFEPVEIRPQLLGLIGRVQR